jgi:hypothetical protein
LEEKERLQKEKEKDKRRETFEEKIRQIIEEREPEMPGILRVQAEAEEKAREEERKALEEKRMQEELENMRKREIGKKIEEQK